MRGIRNKGAREYQYKIKKSLRFLPRDKRAMYKDLFSELENYVANHPNHTAEQLEAIFGAPHDIVSSAISTEEMKKFTQRYKRKIILFVTICATLAVALAFTSYCIYRANLADGSYIITNHGDVTPDEPHSPVPLDPYINGNISY